MQKKQTIVILGAGGQLASDLCKYAQINEKVENEFKIITFTHDQLDISNRDKLTEQLNSIKPNFVINTAAYHKVDEIENNQLEAFSINAIVQKNLAEICNTISSTLVFFSSDYVFGLDKTRKTPYLESDEVGPVNVYGVSKFAGELMVRNYCPKHFIVRTAGLFGVAGPSGKGSNFVDLMIKLSKEKPYLNVVNDQVTSPTYTLNLAENLYKILLSKEYGTYHMTSEDECSWWDFATEIFKQSKINKKCLPVSSDFFNNTAQRPGYSVLENHHLKTLNLNVMNSWQKNLNLYLKEKKYI